MRTFYLGSLMSLVISVHENKIPMFTGEIRDVDVILSNVSLSGYAIPLEGVVVAILLLLWVYIMLEHNNQMLSKEYFRLALGIINRTHTPLVLLRNRLEDIMKSDIPDGVLQSIKSTSEYVNHIIDCSQIALALDKAEWKKAFWSQIVEVELHNYINSIAAQCKPYADSHHIQLKICHASGYTSCRVNETIMAAALQCLLNRMIDITAPGSQISIIVSHTVSFWKLKISNCRKTERKTIVAKFSMPGYSGLWTVRKIIRLYGGRMMVYKYGRTAIFKVIMPVDCHYRNRINTLLDKTLFSKVVYRNEESIADHRKEHVSSISNNSYVMLIMADSMLSGYLQSTLSGEFNTSVLETFDMAILASIRHKPDTIIIDENVNGVCGDEICSCIKAEEKTADIPVILLVRCGYNESYLSHIGSGADRLEARTVSIYRLKADIHMLIDSCEFLRKRVKRMFADTMSVLPEAVDKEDDNLVFISKVRGLLEKNLTVEGYTIDMLCAGIGMSRTSFYYRMKELTGKSPVEYMFAFKMEKAKILLASQCYSITEIAGMLGYCDAKYFGKKFKSFYHICPTRYMKAPTI